MNKPLLHRGLALLVAGGAIAVAVYLGASARKAHGQIIPNPAFDEFRQHLRTFHTLTVRIGEFHPAEPSMDDERYYPWGPTGGIRNLAGLPKRARRHAGAPEEPWPADLPRVTWVPPQLAWLFQVPPINYPMVGSAPGSALAELHAGGSMLITAREDTWVTVDPHEGGQRLRMGPGGGDVVRRRTQHPPALHLRRHVLPGALECLALRLRPAQPGLRRAGIGRVPVPSGQQRVGVSDPRCTRV